MERRDTSVVNKLRRRFWYVGAGWWGLLGVLAIHQSIVAVSLAVDVWIRDDAVLPVLWPEAAPFMFAAAAAGMVDTHRNYTRGRAAVAHALMLICYLSRALVLAIGTYRYGEFSTTIVIACSTWVVLGAVTHLAWTKVRRELPPARSSP